jgi:hypothetical protein
MDSYITDIIQRYEEDLQKVKGFGLALEFVEEQTLELCLEAVQQNGLALKFVKEKMPELYLATILYALYSSSVRNGR